MSLSQLPQQIEAKLPDSVSEFPWARAIAVGSFLASAYLLLTGKRKAAFAAAAAGATVSLMEHPQVARDLWDSMPRYVRAGQDFLVKAEDLLEQITEQGKKLGNMVGKIG
jgi:hypothetical protein